MSGAETTQKRSPYGPENRTFSDLDLDMNPGIEGERNIEALVAAYCPQFRAPDWTMRLGIQNSRHR